MALLPNINVGSAPNDGTGSSLRDAFTIVNENFQFIEAFFPNSAVANLSANLTSTGTSTFNYVNANVVYSSTFGNAGTLYYGNIATAAQPNITSLGNLTSLESAGAVNFDSYLTVNNTATFSGNISTAQAYFNYGSYYVLPTNTTASTYTVQSVDQLIVANVSAYANTTVTLPNADINTNRVLEFYWYDPDDIDNTANLTLEVELGAGNIVIGGNNVASSTFLSQNSQYAKLLSNGTYWLRLV